MPKRLLTVTAVDSLINKYLDRENKLTVETYQKDLLDFRRYLKAEHLHEAIMELLMMGPTAGNDCVQAYRDRMKRASARDLSGSTINRRLSILRGIVRSFRRNGYIDWELDVPNVKVEPVLNTEGPGIDALRLMLKAEAAVGGTASIRNFAILRLLGELGLRRIEITRLTVADFKPAVFKIHVHGKGKSKKQALSISKASVDAINQWLLHRPGPKSGALFVNLIPGRHAGLTGAAIYEIVKAAGARIKQKARPHGIRHTAITEAIKSADEKKMTFDQVMAFSRHKSVEMLIRYRDPEKAAQKSLSSDLSRKLDS